MTHSFFKTTFAFSFFVLNSFLSFAQPKETVTAYFDENWHVTTQANAAYYRITGPAAAPAMYHVRDYFMSGQIQMDAYCSVLEPDLVFEGKRILYYANGKIKEQGIFNNGNQAGIHQSFYESGAPQQELDYDGEKVKYRFFMTPEGVNLLTTGNGDIPSSTTEDYHYFIKVESFVSTALYRLKGSSQDTIYVGATTPAEYKGGAGKMIQTIVSNLVYPKHARRYDMEGKVFVEFVVGIDGSVRDPRVLKGFDSECDHEAVAAIYKLNQWIPARHDNKVVATVMILPIVFKLNGKRR